MFGAKGYAPATGKNQWWKHILRIREPAAVPTFLTGSSRAILMRSMSDPITIVSGMPRTGTSMMMRMLEAGGIEPVTDRVRRPDVDNPEGYYEYEIVKTIERDTSWLANTRGRAFKMVAMLLVHLPPTHDYEIVFMRRSTEEMLRSQAKMLERLGQPRSPVSDDKLSVMFAGQLRKVDDWLAGQPNIRVQPIEYGAVLEDSRREARRVNRFLGRNLDEAAMAAIVDPALYRNRADATRE